ncbi:MAG TPA: TetR/AcrR family transcriptional regulator [Gordonia sp. (in: high G+C Gram-positive bacteria)]|uniref:TetR/AcrR family transcriptional regulator n=1 Tax=unclassified Gordonia (in: high G+C Gram-positive bacteria) TaxID=2657482 RepID=UPI000FC05C2C|nr:MULTISPECIES: TetR/AcrR family transcriptional regulator [unclassified Gordonia (in: high G+C Gram-positive bacteria)]RUP36620.1 MAG: TetR family transcriptional regulator [Gordonia sp. (in: high G+C Gram-positive bacteria)]HNP56036.1 TetR/AcrR family transcriptional regulator [Gordonia sp. (in: high G+C Gram-positive bacteria)]HRC51807.1 TetR/AcrR family transcriptional regulator [Gordonia sp. (in: high G+C Gram-positive bacteria)]
MIEDRAAQASPLRDRFLAAGMTVLGRDGYPGFKQAAVCRQTGLTTGAFYHSFRNWKEFEAALIEHWRAEATDRIVARLDVALAPHERIDALIAVALSLPHRSEAAIRIWAAGDVRVAESLSAVDAARRDAVARYLREIGIDPGHADRFAATSLLLFIGHQAAGTPLEELEWSMRHFVETDPQVRAALVVR